MGTAVLSLDCPRSAHCGKTGFPPLSSSRPEVVRAARSCDFRRCKLKFARSILNALANTSMINVGSGWAGEPDDRAFGRGVQDGTGCPDDHSKVIKLGSHTTHPKAAGVTKYSLAARLTTFFSAIRGRIGCGGDAAGAPQRGGPQRFPRPVRPPRRTAVAALARRASSVVPRADRARRSLGLRR